MSNRLGKVFEATNRDWNGEAYDTDEFLAHDGRVMDSMLSEHMCEGWRVGYLLTGRHGFFISYEAFIRIVDQSTGTELIRYDLAEDFSIETAIVVGELYRHNGEWNFNAIGSGYQGGLAALCANYGVDVE